MHSLLFLFLDGVGIGPDDATANPFLAAQMPTWRAWAGGQWPTLRDPRPRQSATATVRAADATLGVQGLPQSGTGTTALLTGHNAAQVLGRHAGPYPPRELRPLLEAGNLLTRAARAGRAVTFANAFPPAYLERLARGRARRTACTQAALAAGVELRGLEALRQQQALSAWITNDLWRRSLPELPNPTAVEAGIALATLAQAHDLTLFEYFYTDHLGHRPHLATAQQTVSLLDQFLAGIASILDPQRDLLIVASDHGNFEEQSHGEHTRNPVLITLWGANHAEIADRLDAVTDVAPALTEWLHLAGKA